MGIPSIYILLGLEAGLVCLLLAVALWNPRLGNSVFRACGRSWNRLARNKVVTVVAVGLAAMLIRAILLPILPIPDPTIHDEFGHLLIADTFASGRVTNPAHAMWQHFESIYVLQQPTYTSQYPPATGILLGAAQAVFGHPWWGLLVGMGVFCGLMCWMLQGWLPARWALLGGVLTILQFGIVSYWINSYWGGTVPAIGGVLVLGGLARLRKGSLFRNSVWVAIGLAILMNSRPAEALLLGCVTGVLLCWWVFKTRELRFGPALRNSVLPLGLLLSVTLAGMLYYNYRVTGKPLELPYMLHQKQYGSPQAYWWQRPVIVESFRHQEMKDDYLRQLRLYQRRSSPKDLAKATLGRLRDYWLFYIGVAFTLPFLFFPRILHDRGVLLMLAIGIPFAFDYLTFHAFYPHYAAPIAGFTMFLVVQCWRHLRVWKWHRRPVGLFLARMLPIVSAAGVAGVLLASVAVSHGIQQPVVKALCRDYIPFHSLRADMTKELEAMGGEHLIFVHYRQPGHSPDFEWVYNRADIDKSDVVWAREMNADSDRELRRYFPQRKVWVLDADAQPPRLAPYPATSQQ